MTAPDAPTPDATFDGPAMSGIDASDRPLTARGRALRPFGYLGLAILWLAITIIVLLVLAALPYTLSGQDDLKDAPGIANLAVDNQWIAALIALPLFAILFGGLVFFILQGSLALTMLALIAFTRALRPSFSDEPLTTTRWSGEAIGSIRVGVAPPKYAPVRNKAALSLIPVRRTRFSAFWTSAMLFAFVPSFRAIGAAGLVGLDYVFTLAWVLWPVTGPLAIVFAVVSVALLGLGVWQVVAARRADAVKWTTQQS